MMKGLEVGLVALAALTGGAGCCAYRGISQTALVHVRNVSVADVAGSGTNGVEVAAQGARILAGRVVVVAENVYVSVGGGIAASNDVAGELSVPLVK